MYSAAFITNITELGEDLSYLLCKGLTVLGNSVLWSTFDSSISL